MMRAMMDFEDRDDDVAAPRRDVPGLGQEAAARGHVVEERPDELVGEDLVEEVLLLRIQEDRHEGNIFVDPDTGTIARSRSFSSIYGEWETTGEARRIDRSFRRVPPISGSCPPAC